MKARRHENAFSPSKHAHPTSAGSARASLGICKDWKGYLSGQVGWGPSSCNGWLSDVVAMVSDM